MKVDSGLDRDGLTEHQHFFLSCWFNLSHDESLDSDRVSVFGVHIALKELLGLYTDEQILHREQKREDVGAELHDLLIKETLLDLARYGGVKQDLLQLLKPKRQKGQGDLYKSQVNSKTRLVMSLVEELISIMDEHFVGDAFDALKFAISRINGGTIEEIENNRTDILVASDRLASALIGKGMALQDLFAFYRHILTKKDDPRTFNVKFATIKEKALTVPSEHDVRFKLNSASLVNIIGDENHIAFGQFKIEPLDQSVPKNKNRCMASTLVRAQSMRIAGRLAYDKLSELVDSLSFTLGKEQIIIEKKRYSVSESSGGGVKFFGIHNQVPNPNYKFEPEKFSKFTSSFSQSIQGDGFRSTKIASAFRLARLAQDTESIEARLSTYWTALESITRDANLVKGGADEKVAAAAVPCITIDYLSKRLRSYIATLYSFGVQYLTLPNGGGQIGMRQVSRARFFELLRDPTFSAWLLDEVKEAPYLHYRLSKFIKLCQSPEDLLKTFESHGIKVTRQVKRIYRGRNKIVHDAEKVFAIEFLCAHLEHYLQACIMGMIDVMSSIPTVKSPEESYIRYQHWISSIGVELKADNYGALDRLLVLHD